MKIIYVTVILFLTLITESLACDCFGATSFCNTSQNSLAILEVEVIEKYKGSHSTYSSFVDFKVVNTLVSKDTVQYQNLTLVEDNFSCDRFIIGGLERGDRFFINYSSVRENQEAHYPVIRFNICNIDILSIKGNVVRGLINDNASGREQRMTVNEFRKNVNQLCEFDLIYENSVYVVNNPTQNNIDLKNNHTTALKVELFSSSGQLVYQTSMEPEEGITVDFIDFPAGMYFVRFRNSFTQRTIKTIKVR